MANLYNCTNGKRHRAWEHCDIVHDEDIHCTILPEGCSRHKGDCYCGHCEGTEAALDYCGGGCGRLTEGGTMCAECLTIKATAGYWAYRHNDLVRRCYDCEQNPCICGDIFPFANIRHADGKVYDCNGGLLEDHGRKD